MRVRDRFEFQISGWTWSLLGHGLVHACVFLKMQALEMERAINWLAQEMLQIATNYIKLGNLECACVIMCHFHASSLQQHPSRIDSTAADADLFEASWAGSQSRRLESTASVATSTP